MKKRFAFSFLALAGFLTGCPIARVERFPLPPPVVHVPIDAQLQADAKKEIDSALHSNDEVLRGNAIEVLRDTNLPDGDDKIVEMLKDRSLFVRKAAAIAIGELKIKSAIDKLQPLVDSDMGNTPEEAMEADQTHMAAIFALHRLGDYKYSQEFVKTAFDTRVQIRGDTAFLLGLMNEKSAIPILKKMLHDDKDVRVRLEVAEALWRLGDEEGENALLSGTISKIASDQMMTALALAEPRDTRVLEHIQSMFGGPVFEVDLVCARAAGMLGSDCGYGYAVRGVDSVDPRQRYLAAMAFGDIGRTDSQKYLAKLLKGDDATVRLGAANALIEIAEMQH